jgi:hypothetical protein
MAKSKILETTATTTPQRFQFVIREKIQYLANDSLSYDLKINFDADIDEAGTRTIKAYEVIDDIPMECSYITIQGVGGSVDFRLSGI